jgi:two-component system phosphate regulon response regulator PhoB
MKPHILVVDDEVDMVTMITRILSREGWQVTSANSSEEALVLIQKHHPDAVVLDLRLPSIGGLAVCRLLRENPSTRSIPVIMLTAQSSDIDKVIGLETGADDYITSLLMQWN